MPNEEPIDGDSGLTAREEVTYLNYIPSMFGKALPWVPALLLKHAYEPKTRDRSHPWFKAEFDEMETRRKELKVPNDRTFAFRVYWLAQRYECSEAKVIERITECCNYGGTRYAADVYRFGTDYRFDGLALTGARKATGIGYASGLASLIETPKGWSPKAGTTRPIREVPETPAKSHRRFKVAVPPFRQYVQERAAGALQNAPEIATMAKAYLDSTKPESVAMTKLWGRMLVLILETEFVHVATNLVTVDGKLAVARMVVLEALKM